MAQYADLVGSYENEGPQDEGLAGALFSFDVLRAELAEQSAGAWRPRRARDEVVSAREVATRAELQGIHDAMSEIDQLRLYRFYLTAVHRNSLLMHRFDTSIVAFPDRAAAIERELEEVSAELRQLNSETAEHSALTDPDEAKLQSSNFLWTMVWWLHARPDVSDFKYPNGDDMLSVLLLGRAPNWDEAVTIGIYQCALQAEYDYRRMLLLRVPKNVIPLAQQSLGNSDDFSGKHIPLHMKAEAHM